MNNKEKIAIWYIIVILIQIIIYMIFPSINLAIIILAPFIILIGVLIMIKKYEKERQIFRLKLKQRYNL